MEDIAVYIYWALIVIIITFPNYIFFKKLKDVKGKPIIHKLLYFLICLLTLFAIAIIFMALLTSPYLTELFGLKFDPDSYITRFIYGGLVFPLTYLANIYFGKLYLKRISKTDKNELELIGKE
ncbi:hypothetical protein [Flavobacterium flavigenum]|uniref:hypothetical protein n=1 Tax=Flavobacterium flavigenum TaxID=3003258 RepID=UPI0022AC27A5|nr:hypothetical protein [Flavobacterium flavigenum]